LKGNKSDLKQQREIPRHIGENFAQRHNMQFIETSAKDSENVEQIFLYIAEKLTRQAREQAAGAYKTTTIRVEETDESRKTFLPSCCS
jgi:Ras-related protein Rab-30